MVREHDDALAISSGRLYYKHDTGRVFTARLAELADAAEEEQPYELREAAGWPLGARPYTPDPASPEGRTVDDWTDSVDLAIALAIAS